MKIYKKKYVKKYICHSNNIVNQLRDQENIKKI